MMVVRTDEHGPALAPVDELIEIGERMKQDRARLVELCRQIAGGAGSGLEEAVEASVTPRRGGRRKKVDEVPPAAGGQVKTKKEPWRKIECSYCGQRTGTIRVGLECRPSRHKDASTGGRCPGCDKPGKLEE